MTSFFHPLSAVILVDPPVYATPSLLRLLARGASRLETTYVGDRMWPAISHGQRIAVKPGGARGIARGDVVLAWPGGVPDVLRVERVRSGSLVLAGDSDPGERAEVGEDAVLGRVAVESVPVPRPIAAMRRLFLDLAEAVREGVDASADPADTVREKYQEQAPYYARLQVPVWEPRLSERMRSAVRRGGTILVAGSGAGHEAFGLARDGYRVRGLDYAPAMVEASRRAASELRLSVEFVLGDLRTHDEPAGGLSAVFFTYDVYSFIPSEGERIDLLRRIERWLEPDGSVFLGVRRVKTSYQRFILTLQLARRAGSPKGEWGSSHSRWISLGGTMKRSFVRYFTRRALLAEIESAGLSGRDWDGGHIRVARPGEGRDG